MIKQLNKQQKKYLRASAQSIKPIIIIGQKGINDALIAELLNTLESHELLKIKIRAESRDDRQNIITKIISLTNAQIVQVIGGVLVIYKAFIDKPIIILPKI